MKNNPEQERAIKSIDKNLSVIAGAGTGKTKVLTERFVYILEHGELLKNREIESIVAITFTKKATQEMIERIRREIRKNFPRGEKWRKYYRDMEKANISTIHSFCLNILKENVIAANLDPMFEVIEEYEAQKMLHDSISQVLDMQIEEDLYIYNLFKRMKADRSSYLIDDIVSIYNEIRSIGIDIETIELVTINSLEALEPVAEADLEYIRDTTEALIEDLPKNSKLSKVLKDSQVRLFLQGEAIDDLDSVLAYIEDNIGSNKKEKPRMDKLENIISKVLLSLERENIAFYRAILTVLSKVDLLYKNKKESFGGLDYEDLQIKTNKLLDKKDIRVKYQNKYKYIMIDEFQDTNKLQKQIFYKIASREKDLDRSNLFVVGDPKQSIYGFRGADLDVFYQVVDDIEASNGEDPVSLNKNYRTVSTVIGFINHVFASLMEKDYASLIPAKESQGKIDIEIISNENLILPEGISESYYHRNFEAEQIAKRISVLVAEGNYHYKDFAILFRARTRNHIYEKALNKFAIPYYNIASKGFFKQQEIIDIINGLKSINNMEDRIATIGFLRSNFIGLDDNTIYHIFIDIAEEKNKANHRLKQTDPRNSKLNDHYPNNKLLDSMKNLLEGEVLPLDQRHKLKAGLEIYIELENYKDVYGLVQILESLLKKSLYINTSLLKENARQNFANIHKFVELARDYEEKHRGNLSEFLTYIDDIRENDESLGEIESDNTDAVKILTIHKSKGLEFPVVIIPEMATRPPNFSNKFLFDQDKGLSIGLGKSNPIYNQIKSREMEKKKEETKRVLYVAMTRAEKLLILGNQGKSLGFKKMIEGLLEGQEYMIVDEIDLEPKISPSVRIIARDLVEANLEDTKYRHEEIQENYLPNLYKFQAYGREFQNRISISKYMVFKECKRKYYLDKYLKISNLENISYKYIEEDQNLESETEGIYSRESEIGDLNLEEESPLLSPIEKGVIVHEFCELYRLGLDKKILIEKILHKNGLRYSEEIYDLLEASINNYLKDYSEDYDSVYYEKPFFLQLDGAYINGYIDKLTIKDGKINIEDFKTNKIYNIKDLIERYRPQIQLYAYIAKEILNLPLESAQLVFLENGKRVNLEVDHVSLKANIEEIQNFVDFTRDNMDIEKYEKTSSCSEYCKYKNICNLKEELPWKNI